MFQVIIFQAVLLNFLTGVNHGSMIAPTEFLPNQLLRILCHIPAQIHGNHTRSRNVLRLLGPRKVMHMQRKMIRHHTLDCINGHSRSFSNFIQQIRKLILNRIHGYRRIHCS